MILVGALSRTDMHARLPRLLAHALDAEGAAATAVGSNKKRVRKETDGGGGGVVKRAR